jgi:hypothetical protein
MKTASFVLLFWGLVTQVGQAQPVAQRNLLGQISEATLTAKLVPQAQWRPFPREAAAWRAQLPDSLQRRLVALGEAALAQTWPGISATLLLEYTRTGDRSRHQQPSFKKRNDLLHLVMAEAVEDRGRFTEATMNGVWSICEETFWGVPAHLYVQEGGMTLPNAADPTVDLFAAATAATLAVTDYLVGEKLAKISPLLRPRIAHEVNRRVLAPLEQAPQRYGYLGKGNPQAVVNNWNPWVISNWLTANLLLEKDEARRAKAAHRAKNLMDLYLNSLGDDGASDEGPGYWNAAGACVMDALVLLHHATGGTVTIFDNPFIRRMANYPCQVHAGGSHFLSVSDSRPQVKLNGPALFRYGQSVGDPDLILFSRWLLANSPPNEVSSSIFFFPARYVFDLLAYRACASQPGRPPQFRHTWLPDLQLMTARTANGLLVAAHGGHNDESHNHNDVGDFLLYADGQPMIIDVGAGEYTAKTFSPERYTLWYNATSHHNLPMINGLGQSAGRRFAAGRVSCQTTASGTSLAMDLHGAYPAEAGLLSWRRTVRTQANTVEISDEYTCQAAPRSLTQSFMTACRVDVSQPGRIVFTSPAGPRVALEYLPAQWQATVEKLPLAEPHERGVKANWGENVYRVLLTAPQPSAKAKIKYRITKF